LLLEGEGASKVYYRRVCYIVLAASAIYFYIILPGVHIGRCCVVGAGSVVNHDTEPYSVYVGVPARKIRDLKTGERTGKKEQNS